MLNLARVVAMAEGERTVCGILRIICSDLRTICASSQFGIQKIS